MNEPDPLVDALADLLLDWRDYCAFVGDEFKDDDELRNDAREAVKGWLSDRIGLGNTWTFRNTPPIHLHPDDDPEVA